jgi:hypothetical protein
MHAVLTPGSGIGAGLLAAVMAGFLYRFFKLLNDQTRIGSAGLVLGWLRA